jgi:predicted TIM-barrel fold metal-dependent hydrolase
MPIPEWTAVFVHPTSPCCFESFGLALPAPMIEFPFDTTRAAATPQQIAALRILAPPSQLLYGTDYPFANEDLVRMAEAAFVALPFPPDERQAIRAGNAALTVFTPEPGAASSVLATLGALGALRSRRARSGCPVAS